MVAGGQRSANLTGLDSGVDYLVVVMYVSTGLPGRRSYWSEELLVGTEFGKWGKGGWVGKVG